jgi:hypothetical protein
MSDSLSSKKHIGVLHFFKWLLTDKNESWKTKLLHWVALTIIVLEILLQVLTLFDTQKFKDGEPAVDNIWFWYLQYFTYQSNIIILVVMLLFVGNFGRRDNWKLFKTNLWIVCSTVYITVTCLTYCCYLYQFEWYDSHMLGGSLDYIWYIRSILAHMVCPPLAIFFFIWSCFAPRYYENNLEKISYKNALIKGLIYPVCYFIYAVIINACIPKNSNGSVPVYPYITDFRDYPLYSSLFTIIAIIVFAGLILLFSYISNRWITNSKKPLLISDGG